MQLEMQALAALWDIRLVLTHLRSYETNPPVFAEVVALQAQDEVNATSLLLPRMLQAVETNPGKH